MESDKVGSPAYPVAIEHGTDHPTSGRLTLRTLRLKKGALDKFRLPVDVVEGDALFLLRGTAR